MVAPKLSDEDAAKIREGHILGKSLNSIARELGVNPSTVSRWAKKEGLLWTGVPAAADVVRERLAFNRMRLSEAALADALALRERMWSEHEVIVNTPAGPERMSQDLPDAKATADFAKAIERLAKSHAVMAEFTSTSSVDHSKSMLMQMQTALEKYAAEYEAEAAAENGSELPEVGDRDQTA
ncbi:helix-turn-helix domain-containing protein [Rhodococcus sp. ZPP]|uniref:helix-turn-helix domain-containing protein n=1 Tax=Rhodococcus sp. ZPP TaxID=2749906 RepID=UPI001AD85F80|nr:helix-turn-helix domain-containing protein [Rhodococcus sp. ZPP]QTJ65860.1 helix-turn-helix domain-containing protein [Rhodococcus sp. ZPP]